MAHKKPQVQLGGYNVDADQLRRLIADRPAAEPPLTPESVAAAYARLSRRDDTLAELRAEAVRDVAKARASMTSIVHLMGHQAISEHAVFNLDFNFVTRLGMELIETHRLAAYTERSQRYVKFGDDYLLPPEIAAAGLGDDFAALYRQMFQTYEELYAQLRPYFVERGGDPALLKKSELTALENLAKEDARYAFGLAVQTALGGTFNARELELLVRRLLSSPLWEARDIGGQIKAQVQPLAPSLIKYCDPCDYFAELPDAARAVAAGLPREAPDENPPRVALVHATPETDEHVLAALLYTGGAGSIVYCMNLARGMSADEKLHAYRALVAQRQTHDNVSRHFELPRFVFDLNVSASLYAQLKRHRLTTQLVADYDPALGITVPPSIEAIGRVAALRAVAEHAAALHERVLAETGCAPAAAYCLTNAHRRRVLVTMNLRELHHFAKERMAAFAQWDIRETAVLMADAVREVAPLTGRLLVGKDNYREHLDRLLADAEG